MASSTLIFPNQKELTQSVINVAPLSNLQLGTSISSRINSDIVSLYTKGTELYNQQKYKEAITTFDTVLELSPKFVEAYLNRGASFLKLGDYSNALEDFESALKLKPNYADAWSNKGAVFEQQGQYEEALLAFNKAIKYQPNNHKGWYSRGYSLLHLTRFADSIIAIEQSIELQSQNYDAWLNLGSAKTCLHSYLEALDAYESAITIEPNRSDAWLGKGLSLIFLERYDDAIAAYTHAIELKQELSIAWYNRACAYALKGNADTAIQDLEKAICLFPNWREDAKTEPDFDLIRDDSEFQSLLGGMQDSSPADQYDTETPEPTNPWMKSAGMYENDPLFDDVLAEIEIYRHDTSLGESGLSNFEELVQEMRIAAAVKWYEIGKVSQSIAAKLSGLNRAEFINALTRYKVSPFQYTAEELLEDLVDAD